jgi:hypothetical protein
MIFASLYEMITDLSHPQKQDEYKSLVDLHSPRKTDMNNLPEEPEASTPRHEPTAIAKSQANTVYQLVIELKDEGHLAKRRLHIDLLAERLSEKYSFSPENAHKIIAARANAVLEMLDEDDTPSFKWSRYVIHRELTNAASQNVILPPGLLTPLQSTEDSSDDEHLIRTQKSVLRPKGNSSVSGKVMGKRNRNANADQQNGQSGIEADADADADAEDEDEDEDEDMEDVETPSKVRGHELIRTPLASAKVQDRSFLGNPQSAAASLLKSVLSADVPKSSALTSSAINGRLSFGVGHLSGGQTNGLVEPEIWTCRIIGCSKTITSKGEERRKEISDHGGEHDWDFQMQVELVEAERRLQPNHPVSNMMQYLLNQHNQQMRAAFPEIYPQEIVVNGTTEQLDITSIDEEHFLEPEPNHDLSAELDLSVNGHTT